MAFVAKLIVSMALLLVAAMAFPSHASSAAPSAPLPSSIDLLEQVSSAESCSSFNVRTPLKLPMVFLLGVMVASSWFQKKSCQACLLLVS
eukprot:CAMPEP_0170605536 /NCGR_PEP_ID=MMETSP0224-20130122/20024_1 /TAXON_ID=285029 /ORGANISM="Togula jolla, Strain CCCM 725" /LENGTH=89 /DNA_ID=CAMNT_0010930543 /DNA_START=71 /DNA_END=340 /DNA_ORIENTATION=+